MPAMNLKELALNFVKSRNAFTKKFDRIREEENIIKAESSEEKEYFCVFEELPELSIIRDLPDKSDKTTLITLNTKENFNKILDYWEFLAHEKRIFLVFVNPSANDKWVLHPASHNLIS